MITKTNISVKEDGIELYRIINSKLCVIEFSLTITCANASHYFNMVDTDFTKFCKYREISGDLKE